MLWLTLTLMVLYVIRMVDSSLIINSLLDEEAQGSGRASRSPCKGQVCKSPPSDAQCTFLRNSDTSVKRPKGDKVPCCSLYKCYNKDGSFYPFHGIYGKGAITKAPQTTTTTRRPIQTTKWLTTKKTFASKDMQYFLPRTSIPTRTTTTKPIHPNNSITTTTLRTTPGTTTTLRTTVITTTSLRPTIKSALQKNDSPFGFAFPTFDFTQHNTFDSVNKKKQPLQGESMKNQSNVTYTATTSTPRTTTKSLFDRTDFSMTFPPMDFGMNGMNMFGKEKTTPKTTKPYTFQPMDMKQNDYLREPTKANVTTTSTQRTTTKSLFESTDLSMNFPPMDFGMNGMDMFGKEKTTTPKVQSMNMKPNENAWNPSRTNSQDPTTSTQRTTTKSLFDRTDFSMTFPSMDFGMNGMDMFGKEKTTTPKVQPINMSMRPNENALNPSRTNLQDPTTSTQRTTTKSLFDSTDFSMNFPPMDFGMNGFEKEKTTTQSPKSMPASMNMNLNPTNQFTTTTTMRSTTKSLFESTDLSMNFPSMDFGMNGMDMFGKEKTTPKSSAPSLSMDMGMNMNFRPSNGFTTTTPRTSTKSLYEKTDFSMTFPPMDFDMAGMMASGNLQPSVNGKDTKVMKNVDENGNVAVNVVSTGDNDAVAFATDGDGGGSSNPEEAQKELEEQQKMMADMQKEMDGMMGKK